jgi:hypothetical protein
MDFLVLRRHAQINLPDLRDVPVSKHEEIKCDCPATSGESNLNESHIVPVQ